MSLQFFYMMNVTMLSRLAFLFGDGRLSRKQWMGMIIFQFLALGVFEVGINLWLLSGSVIVINILFLWGDSHFKRLDLFRFCILLLFAIMYSIFFSPLINLSFNSQLSNQYPNLVNYSSIFTLYHQLGFLKISIVIFGLLLVSNEANLLIRACFQFFGLVSSRNNQSRDRLLLKPVNAKELNSGRVIGMLERMLMYFLVLGGAVGSIGFVLAAKAFARFRELDERSFAEYVLIGTLLSTLLAVLISYFIRILLS